MLVVIVSSRTVRAIGAVRQVVHREIGCNEVVLDHSDTETIGYLLTSGCMTVKGVLRSTLVNPTGSRRTASGRGADTRHVPEIVLARGTSKIMPLMGAMGAAPSRGDARLPDKRELSDLEAGTMDRRRGWLDALGEEEEGGKS